MKIAFIWQGFNEHFDKWGDGLSAAMTLLETQHDVKYFDFPLKDIYEFNPDIVLYWEAPVTQRGKDALNWNSVCNLPFKKALFFAGGPLKAFDVKDFDLLFVESKINEEECENQNIPYKRAFGVNTSVFRPQRELMLFDAFMQGTFAAWKRHTLFAAATGQGGAVAGRKQEHDTEGYNACLKHKVTIFPEQLVEEVNILINASYCVLNTSEYWGGGQRCTLEAMAAGVPVIVMADSPKNREYVEESGGGIVCEPTVEAIQKAIKEIKTFNTNYGALGLEYIQNGYTEYHYAYQIIKGIESII